MAQGFSSRDPTGFNAEGAGCAEKALCTVAGRAPKGLDPAPTQKPAGAGRSKGSAPKPSAPAADAAGAAPPTGAVAQPSPSPSSTPAPAVEAPSTAPIAVPSAPTLAVAGGPDEELPPESWRASTAAQGVGGFAAGLAIGLVPFGTLFESFLTQANVIGQGTRAARIGLYAGEMVGGTVQSFLGIGGGTGGVLVSSMGAGAAVGFPAFVGSAVLVMGGTVNTAVAGTRLWEALSTGGETGEQTHRLLQGM